MAIARAFLGPRNGGNGGLFSGADYTHKVHTSVYPAVQAISVKDSSKNEQPQHVLRLS